MKRDVIMNFFDPLTSPYEMYVKKGKKSHPSSLVYLKANVVAAGVAEPSFLRIQL